MPLDTAFVLWRVVSLSRIRCVPVELPRLELSQERLSYPGSYPATHVPVGRCDDTSVHGRSR